MPSFPFSTTVQQATVSFDYVNHRGEAARRRAAFISLEYMATSYHPETQWIMTALCLDRREIRQFALSEMKNVISSLNPRRD